MNFRYVVVTSPSHGVNPSDVDWRGAIDALHAMSSLAEDCDGMGSPPPPRDVISGATRIAELLRDSGEVPPPGSIVPTTAGTVIIEWFARDFYLEAEVLGPDRVELMMLAADKATHWDAGDERSMARHVMAAMKARA